MTVALYVRAGVPAVGPRRPRSAPAGRRRRRIRAAEGAYCLIFIELMLVTAIALFFSTFSSPILSAALTFGVYVVGHFNADLKNFDSIVDSRPRRGWRAASITCCRIFSAFDVKTDVVHGLPVTPGTWRRRRLYGGAYIAALLLVRDVRSSRDGISSDRTSGQCRRVARRRRGGFLCAASAMQVAAGRGYPRESSGHANGCSTCGRRRCAGSRCSTSTRSPPTSTGSARSSITAASVCRAPRRAAVRAALPAARPHDVARSVLHHRVPVRRDLPERAVSRRRGPSGSGDRAAAQGHRRAADQVAVLPRHRRSSTTGTCATTRRRRRGSGARPAQPGAPNWLAAARRVDARSRRTTAPRRATSGSRSSNRTRSGCGARRAGARPARRPRSHRRDPCGDPPKSAPRRGEIRIRGTPWRDAVSLPGVPLDPTVRRSSSIRRPGAITVSRELRSSSRCPKTSPSGQ